MGHGLHLCAVYVARWAPISASIILIPLWPQKARPGRPRARTHCSAPFEDKAGPGGLLPGEIPGILNICDICDIRDIGAASPSSAVPSTLCRFPLVILQQAAQSFATQHCSHVPVGIRLPVLDKRSNAVAAGRGGAV